MKRYLYFGESTVETTGEACMFAVDTFLGMTPGSASTTTMHFKSRNGAATDDVVTIDGRPARVVRVGMWKTIFFVYDVDMSNGKPMIKGGSKMAIQNDMIKGHTIEKPLPMLDLSKWDDCEDEK